MKQLFCLFAVTTLFVAGIFSCGPQRNEESTCVVADSSSADTATVDTVSIVTPPMQK